MARSVARNSSVFTYLLAAVLLLAASTLAREVLQSAQPLDNRVEKLTSAYLTNEELVKYLEDYSKRCSSIAKLHSIGKSVQGVPLLALEITAQPGVEDGKPEVKYAANIHGDEPSGRQLLLLLAETLCAEYKQPGSPEHRLVSSVRLFLLPTLNPDGFALGKRENSNLVDLNRNFPDPIRNKGQDLRKPLGREEKETLAIMNFTESRRFVASLALHEGAIVANYPFDGYTDGSMDMRGTLHVTPDDATFKFMASTYAELHTTMSQSTQFPGGITNGAQWYPLYGGMQDWNYLAAGCLEVTLELNNDKYPPPSRLAQMWTENAQALVTWPLQTVLAGVQGTVLAMRDGKPAGALLADVSIKEDGAKVTTDLRTGKFARVLAPGQQYTVTATAEGFKPVTTTVTVPKNDTGLQLLFKLSPAEEAQASTVAVLQDGVDADKVEAMDDQQQQQQRSAGKQADPVLPQQQLLLQDAGSNASEDGSKQTKTEAPTTTGSVKVLESDQPLPGALAGSVGSLWLAWGLAVGIPALAAVAFFVLRRGQQVGSSGFPRPPGYQPARTKEPMVGEHAA